MKQGRKCIAYLLRVFPQAQVETKREFFLPHLWQNQSEAEYPFDLEKLYPQQLQTLELALTRPPQLLQVLKPFVAIEGVSWLSVVFTETLLVAGVFLIDGVLTPKVVAVCLVLAIVAPQQLQTLELPLTLAPHLLQVLNPLALIEVYDVGVFFSAVLVVWGGVGSGAFSQSPTIEAPQALHTFDVPESELPQRLQKRTGLSLKVVTGSGSGVSLLAGS